MGQKSCYLWRLPDGNIQGQAGKPFAHQPGSTLKFPCLSDSVPNGCLCNYGATKYFAYYEYLSPELQAISDALVSDPETGSWIVSSTKGHKWHSLGSPVYIGGLHPDQPQSCLRWTGYDVAWPQISIDQKPNTSDNLLRISGVAPHQLYHGQITYPVRKRLVNTFKPYGGQWYEGTAIAPWQDHSNSISILAVSTDNPLCGVCFIGSGDSYVSCVESVAGVYYLNVNSTVFYNNKSIPTSASVWFYSQISSYNPSLDWSYCRALETSTEEAAISVTSEMLRRASCNLPWAQGTWHVGTPIQYLYLQQYKDTPLDWHLQSCGIKGKQVAVLSQNTQRGLGSFDNPFNTYSYYNHFLCITKRTTKQLGYALFSASTAQQSSTILSSFLAPGFSTAGQLASRYLALKGYGSYPPLIQYSDSTSLPINQPELQSWAVDSNYVFPRFNIWQVNLSVSIDPKIDQPIIKAPSNTVTIQLAATSLYQYQLYQQGWVVNDRFTCIKKGHPGKFFYPVQVTNTFVTADQLYQYIAPFNSFNVNAGYRYRNARLRRYQEDGQVYFSVQRLWMSTFSRDYTAGDAKKYYNQLYRELNSQPRNQSALSKLYQPVSVLGYRLLPNSFIDTKNQRVSYVASDYPDIPQQDRALVILPTQSLTDIGFTGNTGVPWFDTWHDVGYPIKTATDSHLYSQNVGLPFYIPNPNNYCSISSVISIPSTAKQWYRACKYVPFCATSGIAFSKVPLGNDTSNSLLYFQYPATMAQGQVFSSLHSNQYAIDSNGYYYLPTDYYKFFDTDLWTQDPLCTFKGPKSSDSLFNLYSDSLSSFYLHFSSGKPKTYGPQAALSNSLFLQKVDRYTYFNFRVRQSDSIIWPYFGNDLISKSIKSRWILAVSGTPCASCVSFSTLYFQPEAELPEARLGYTYIQFPARIQGTYFYSTSAAETSFTQIILSSKSCILDFVSVSGYTGYYSGTGFESYYHSYHSLKADNQTWEDSSWSDFWPYQSCSGYVGAEFKQSLTSSQCNTNMGYRVGMMYDVYWSHGFYFQSYASISGQQTIPGGTSQQGYSSVAVTAPVTVINKNF